MQLSAISCQPDGVSGGRRFFEDIDVQDFRQLKVWQKAHELTLSVYEATRIFPPEELYGLTSQIRRASLSVAANLAEGCGCGGDGDFGRFVQIAMRSASEVEYHLLLARDLKLLEARVYASLQDQVTEVKKMLASLLKTLRASA